MTTVDPNDPKCHGKPLWVVFGHPNEPSIMPCMLRAYCHDSHRLLPVGLRGTVVIWGYSVWRRKPGYRTYGIELHVYGKRHALEPVFFDSHDEAIERIRSLTTVSVRLLKEIEITKQIEEQGK